MQIRVARPTCDLGPARAFYSDAVAVAELAASIGSAGYEVKTASNPYWAREGAIAFVDPDGYWLVLSPGSWS